ncbi:MAG: UvrB/UvrC motif-containing protein [Candidatus Delongbacteria bacterium]
MMMKCDKCGSLNVLSKIVIQGEKTTEEMNLCPQCFQKFVKEHPELTKGSLGRSLHQILNETLSILNSGLFSNGMSAGRNIASRKVNNELKQCPVCSTPELTVLKKGIVGCGYCYTHFSKTVERYLFKLTGSNIKEGQENKVLKIDKKNILKTRLTRAVETENYELAAKIRDEILQITNSH